jgi:hypothetical protein
MPVLYLPYAAYHKIPPSNISLKIECLELGDALIPVDSIIIRQPYPNSDYYVAGILNCHPTLKSFILF